MCTVNGEWTEYCRLSVVLILYWIWVSVPHSLLSSHFCLFLFSPPFSSVSPVSALCALFNSFLLFSLLSYLSAFPLSLSFFCPSTSMSTCLSAISSSSFLHGIPLSIWACSVSTYSLLSVPPFSFSPECQLVLAVAPITYFSHQSLPVFIDTISQKKNRPLKDLLRSESPHVLCWNREGKVRHL